LRQAKSPVPPNKIRSKFMNAGYIKSEFVM
jgi:hypothetical protein